MSDPRIHQVSCSLTSGPEGSGSFEEAERLCNRLDAYARRLGFGVLHENVDEDMGGRVSDVLAAHDAGGGR